MEVSGVKGLKIKKLLYMNSRLFLKLIKYFKDEIKNMKFKVIQCLI